MTSTPWSFRARSRISAPGLGAGSATIGRVCWLCSWRRDAIAVALQLRQPACANKMQQFAHFCFPKIAPDPSIRAWIVCVRAGSASAWWRNQVACRLVYCPVTSRARRAASASVISPRRCAASSGTPCARIAGSAGSSPSASSARTSASAPGRQHGGEPPGDRLAQRLPRRIEQHRAEAPGRRARRARACHAASPRPVPRHTSQARARRWLSVGRSRAAVAGSTAASAGVQRRRPELRQQPPRLRPRRLAGIGDVGDALGQRRRNTARCRRTGSAAARRRAPLPSPPAPRRATTRRCPARAPAARRTARCGTARFLRRRRPGGEDAQLAVDLHASALITVPPSRSASASASADLPLAVGPATISAAGSSTDACAAAPNRPA